MKQFKLSGIIGLLLLIIVLYACVSRAPIDDVTESSAQATSENTQRNTESVSQQQTDIFTTTNVPMTKPIAIAPSITTKAAIMEETTKTLQTRPYPKEITPEIEKNIETFETALPFGIDRAESIAKRIYVFGLGEVVVTSVYQFEQTLGYKVQVKDVDGTEYMLIITESGDLRRIYRESEREPIYMALN